MPFVSAGVYGQEIDLSLFATTNVPTVFGMAHTFKKGAINSELLLTDIDDLIAQCGTPINPASSTLGGQGWYAAREFLRKGNQLRLVRVESTANPALDSSIALPGGSEDTLAVIADGVTSIPATKTLTSATDFAAAGVQAGDVVEIHDVSSGDDNGFYVVVTAVTTTITVDRDFPTGSLTVLDCTVWSGKKEGSGSITGSGDGATSVPATREFTSALSTFTTNGVNPGDILQVNDATSTEDNGIYVIGSVDSETVLTLTRAFPEGSLTGLDFTVFGPMETDTDGDTSVDGTFTSAGSKFAALGVVAGDILYVKDSVDTGDNGYYMITGTITETSFSVGLNRAWPVGLTNLDFEIWPGSIRLDTLSPGTWATGLLARSFANTSDGTNINLEIFDSTGQFLQERIQDIDRTNATDQDDVSVIFEASVVANRTEPIAGGWDLSTPSPPRPELAFSGGDDGLTGIVDADFIGQATGPGGTPTGLQALANPEKTDISLVAIPGYSSQNIGDAIVLFAEARADCLGLLDPPDFPTVSTIKEILDWHNGTNIRTTAFNTSYASLDWTWQEVYDEFNAVDVWTAPSGHVAGVMAYNDRVSHPWFAAAGLKRGKVVGSKDTRLSPDQGQRDALQGSLSAAVNPIVNFVAKGIHRYGQKTLLRVDSALNRENVRRMLLTVEKIIASATRVLVFDPNDPILFREFEQLVTPPLDHTLTNRGIQEYSIVDATTDTDRDNVTFRGRMFIKPTKAAEIIVLEFVLTSQGANFEELIAA